MISTKEQMISTKEQMISTKEINDCSAHGVWALQWLHSTKVSVFYRTEGLIWAHLSLNMKFEENSE